MYPLCHCDCWLTLVHICVKCAMLLRPCCSDSVFALLTCLRNTGLHSLNFKIASQSNNDFDMYQPSPSELQSCRSISKCNNI